MEKRVYWTVFYWTVFYLEIEFRSLKKSLDFAL